MKTESDKKRKIDCFESNNIPDWMNVSEETTIYRNLLQTTIDKDRFKYGVLRAEITRLNLLYDSFDDLLASVNNISNSSKKIIINNEVYNYHINSKKVNVDELLELVKTRYKHAHKINIKWFDNKYSFICDIDKKMTIKSETLDMDEKTIDYIKLYFLKRNLSSILDDSYYKYVDADKTMYDILYDVDLVLFK